MKKEKKIACLEDVRELPQAEQMKYEIADEIGVLDKVFTNGWGSLSSKESGRIGGILRSRSRSRKEQQKQYIFSLSYGMIIQEETERS